MWQTEPGAALRAADVPAAYNAVHLLEHNLDLRPDAPALVSDERSCTFLEIAEEAALVTGALRRSDVRPEERVAILCPDMVEWVAVFFGALKAGAVAVGLNTLLKPRDYEGMLRDCRARILVVHHSLAGAVSGLDEELDNLDEVIVIGGDRDSYRAWIHGGPPERGTYPTHRDDPCTLNYSSGTTGEPKGIPHAHKDLPLTAHNWGLNVLGLRPDDRTFAAAKLFFTFGLGGNLLFPWYVGASSILFPGPPRIATNVLEQVARHRPTLLFHAPTGYASMLAVDGLTTEHDLSSLRLCVSAGESLPAPIWHAWKERTGLDILDGIGSTENFHIFLSNRPDDIRPGASGKPFPGYEVRVVDDAGAEVPRGEVGNLEVRGETASLAYVRNDEASRRTFRGDWLVTGDKYRCDEDGYYWHAGRSDDMLKVGGIWVSPVEVESTLVSHPAVLECAVVGCEDDAGLVKPKAYVLLAEGNVAGEELSAALVQHCTDSMAAYKRPRWIEFVEELPKTATGKIQRFRLRS